MSTATSSTTFWRNIQEAARSELFVGLGASGQDSRQTGKLDAIEHEKEAARPTWPTLFCTVTPKIPRDSRMSASPRLVKLR